MTFYVDVGVTSNDDIAALYKYVASHHRILTFDSLGGGPFH